MLVKKIGGIFFIFFLCLFIASPCAADRACGDLTGFDFQNKEEVVLDGLWDFYWMQLLLPGSSDSSVQKCYLPGLWSDYEIDGKHLSNFGYATYRLHISLPVKTCQWGLKLPVINTAYNIYLDNEKIFSMGQTGRSRDEMLPRIRPVVIPILVPEGKREFDLSLQISNFYNEKSGFYSPIKIGCFDQLLKDQHENIYIEFSMLGVNLLLILFILFLIIRTKKSSLVFLLFFGICAVSNHLLYNEMIIYYIFPDLTYEIIIKLTSLTYFMGGSLILALVGFQYKSETCKPIVYISIVYSFFVFNHIFFQDFYFFENFPFVNQTKIYSLIFIIVGQIQYAYAVFILVWARKHKRQGAGYYLLCLLLFWLVTLLVFFKYYNLCKISLINLALLFFIFAIVFYHYRAQFKPSATDDVSQLVDFRADEGKKKFLAQFPLSMQEQRIMYLILDKQSSREIASSLQLSVRTVENYTYRIFRKCSIKSRVELLALFYTHSALAPSLDREKGRALGSPAGMPVTNKRKKFPHPL